jgi:hypothetical protein
MTQTQTGKRKRNYLQNLLADTSRAFLVQLGLSGIIRRLEEGKDSGKAKRSIGLFPTL